MSSPRKAPAATTLPETRLVELRAQGQARRPRFVDPVLLDSCMRVLDRRGEQWAASVLGRDISRRSIAVRDRPFLHGGEDYTLVLADRAEDDLVLATLAHEHHE